MNIDVILLLLRVLSAGLLLLIVGALFWFIWRDYRTTLSQITANRRAYGNLVAMREVDSAYVMTGDIYPLLPLTSMGRSPTNTILVNDNFASTEHALIARRNGQWWLEDRSSRNGTTLNSGIVTRAVVITNGDIIGIGNMRYRVDLEN
ncbi:MAG TPA: FHA domain-containing protein [Phototrophicaceae bacterium]|nr:FHA domain-containing protein [Phototrophicaceae bacterium]